ncbi:hypothetical protein IEQ34_017461 [Dendrobium chrysotoxum]|uniref:Uncharacterized protein n=1 Tax=Dendrobium chrysotoxum TaxID=161865 RepID=A0AAV7GC16_DENCH|nr:hypothetical protein IEQ34_017461 [Dendrobium chrysotoxum]
MVGPPRAGTRSRKNVSIARAEPTLCLSSFPIVSSFLLGEFTVIEMGTDQLEIERKSSLEKEPRTLSLCQIQYAREAALDVLSNKTMEEALSIFTEGLQPVLNVTEGRMNLDDTDLFDLIRKRRSFGVLEGFRDISTAPF